MGTYSGSWGRSKKAKLGGMAVNRTIRNKILAMDPGPNLNYLATQVMGIDEKQATHASEYCGPDFSGDIAAAWPLAEKYGFVIGPEFEVGFEPAKRIGYAVYRNWQDAADDVDELPGNQRCMAIAKTAPEAICKAALLAFVEIDRKTLTWE